MGLNLGNIGKKLWELGGQAANFALNTNPVTAIPMAVARQVAPRVAPAPIRQQVQQVVQQPQFRAPQMPRVDLGAIGRAVQQYTPKPQDFLGGPINMMAQPAIRGIGDALNSQPVKNVVNKAWETKLPVNKIMQTGLTSTMPVTGFAMDQANKWFERQPGFKQVNSADIAKNTINSIGNAPVVREIKQVPGIKQANEYLVAPLVHSIGEGAAREFDAFRGAKPYQDTVGGAAQAGLDVANTASLAYAPAKAATLAKGGKAALNVAPEAFARGAAAGGGYNAAQQVTEGKNPYNMDWGQIGIGAITGGTANAALPYAFGKVGRTLNHKAVNAARKTGESATGATTAATAATKRADIADNRPYTSRLIDDQANQFQAGKINEKQFRNFVIDDFQQRYGRNPSKADINSLMAKQSPDARVRGEQIIKDVRAGTSPVKFRTQADVTTFPEAGKLRAQGIDAEVVPTNRPTVKLKNQANIADTAPIPDPPEVLLQKAGYKLNDNGEWINPKGKVASIGEMQTIIEPKVLAKAEADVRAGKIKMADTQAIENKVAKQDPLEALKAEAKKYKSADHFAIAGVHGKVASDSKRLILYKGKGGELDLGDATGMNYIKKAGESKIDMPKNTTSFTENPFRAREYGNIRAYSVPTKDVMPTSEYKKLLEKTTGGFSDRGLWRRADKYPNLIGDIQKAGYKGFKDTNGEVVLLDKKIATDLYNQVHKPSVKLKDNGIIADTAPKPGKLTPEDERIGRELGLTRKQMLDAQGQPANLRDNPVAAVEKYNEMGGNIDGPPIRTKDSGLMQTPQLDAPHDFQGLFERQLGKQDVSTELTQSHRVGLRGARDEVKKLNPLRAMEHAIGTGLEKLSRGNRFSRAIARTTQFVNKEAGQDASMIKASHAFHGAEGYNEGAIKQLAEKVYNLVPDEKSLTKVHAILDPETATKPVSMGSLSKTEKQAVGILRDIGDTINDTSYRQGMITKQQWESNKGGKYIARLYKEVQDSDNVAEKVLDIPDARGLFLGMYKNRVDMNEQLKAKLVRDPVKLAAIRMRQVANNSALIDYMGTAEKLGYVSTAPKPGFVKADKGSRMANWSGKYVRQDVYENINGFTALHKSANVMNDVLDLYDGNPARRLRKRMLTIYNPIVRAGNVTSNYFFAYLNGVNPATFQKNKIWAHGAIKANDPIYIAAQKADLVNNDLVKTDRNLFNKDKQFLRSIDKDTNIARKADDKLTKNYGQTDDIAKLAALKSHLDRGYSMDDAVEMTRRGFQDYSRVGHAYDMGAKMPIFGNAFIRFQGDLFTNILKNAAVDHPARLASIPLGILALGNSLSSLSGETAEDKKTRENRVGAPTLPFTNISLEFQIPDFKGGSLGVLDAARFLGIYNRTDIDGNSLADNISRVSPVNVFNPADLATEEGRRNVIKMASTDPLIGPMLGMLFDVDYRGKSIADPSGVTSTGKQLFPDNPLSEAEKLRNRVQYAVRSYAAYPMNEIGDIMASIRGDAKNEQMAEGDNVPDNSGKDFLAREGYNTSGSLKNVAQSLGRLAGVRVQQYGAEQAQQERDKEKMFAGFADVDKFKQSLDNKTRQWFESAHGSVKNRDGSVTEFTDDPLYVVKRAGDLLDDKKFEAEKQYAYLQNKQDGKPIDPIFNLSRDLRLKVLQKKQLPPGAKDPELSNLYTQEWYQDLQNQQEKYYAAKQAYNSAKGYKNNTAENTYPTAPPAIQRVMDQFNNLPKGTGARSQWIRNNPQAFAAMKDQWAKKDHWENQQRIGRGLAATEGAEGVANGFQNASSGSGFASGGGGGNYQKNAGSAYKYAVRLNAGGSVAKPKVTAKGLKSVRSVARANTQPKVSLKRSLV